MPVVRIKPQHNSVVDDEFQLLSLTTLLNPSPTLTRSLLPRVGQMRTPLAFAGAGLVTFFFGEEVQVRLFDICLSSTGLRVASGSVG